MEFTIALLCGWVGIAFGSSIPIMVMCWTEGDIPDLKPTTIARFMTKSLTEGRDLFGYMLFGVMFPYIATMYLLSLVSNVTFLKGGVSMMWLLRKAFAKSFYALFLVSIGAAHPWNYALDWYNAPPTPPSPEAQKLIASLESAEGWITSSSSYVSKGTISVHPDTILADILIGNMNCNKEFSYSDRHAINKAASSCVRKLTAKEIGNN